MHARVQFTPEQRKQYDLKKVGSFYAVPGWDWEGNPLKGAGCVHSTLADMVLTPRITAIFFFLFVYHVIYIEGFFGVACGNNWTASCELFVWGQLSTEA